MIFTKGEEPMEIKHGYISLYWKHKSKTPLTFRMPVQSQMVIFAYTKNKNRAPSILWGDELFPLKHGFQISPYKWIYTYIYIYGSFYFVSLPQIVPVCHARPSLAGPGLAGPGQAWQGHAKPGLAGPGQAWPGQARPGLASPRLA